MSNKFAFTTQICFRPIFKIDDKQDFVNNFKAQTFDLTNIDEANNKIAKVVKQIKDIQDNKKFSNTVKQDKFNNYASGIDNEAIRKTAQDFDILNGSVDDFANNALANLYASEIKVTTGFVGVKSTIDTFNSSQIQGTESEKAYAQAVGQTNANLGKYLTNLNGAKASMHGYAGNLALTATKTIGLKVATMALNTALNAGIAFLVSEGISLLNDWIHSEERAKEAADELKNSYDETTSNIESNLSAVSGFSEEFKKLSKGVDENGNNVSLTADQYSRYKEIVEELVDINPNLLKGYNSENEAIIDKNSAIERTIELLKEQQRLENKKLVSDDSLETLVEGTESDFENIKSKFKDGFQLTSDNGDWLWSGNLKDARSYLQGGINNLATRFNTNSESLVDMSGLQKYWSMSGAEFLREIESFKNEYKSIIAEMLSSDEIDKFRAEYQNSILDKMIPLIQEKYTPALKELDELSKSLNNTLQYAASSMSEYDDLSEGQKSFISSYINNFSIGYAEDIDDWAEDMDKYEEEIKAQKENIEKLVKDIPNDISLSSGIDLLFELNDDMTVQEYQKQVQEIIATLQQSEYFKNKDENDILLEIGLGIKIEGSNDVQTEVETIVKNIKERALKTWGYNVSFDTSDINTVKELSDLDFENFDNFAEAMDEVNHVIADTNNIETLAANLNDIKENQFDNATKGLEKFNSALEQLVNNESLSGDEVFELINLNDNLAGAFTKTSDGFTVNIDKMQEARREYVKETLSNVEKEIEANKALAYSQEQSLLSQKDKLAELKAKRTSLVKSLAIRLILKAL